ncbi:MAG TPA: YraN family protein, partial [Ktedonobacteraceae bacterium]|nr:YraN family protein [Ktedonobacteraceae bacterium]
MVARRWRRHAKIQAWAGDHKGSPLQTMNTINRPLQLDKAWNVVDNSREGTRMERDGSEVGKPKNTMRQEFGRLGERLAAEALRERGYRILQQNFRCRYGEIDLVAEDALDLVFVEVKTRKGSLYGLPEEAVTRGKRRKLVQVASYYLDFHAIPERSWRIDVVAVQFSKAGKLEEIRVYQYAVSEE